VFGLNEALLSFIRRQVGLRTDAASASGSLHAKVKDVKNDLQYMGRKIKASNTVKLSAPTSRSFELSNTSLDVIYIVKQFAVYSFGTVRVKFDVTHTQYGGAPWVALVLVNGEIVYEKSPADVGNYSVDVYVPMGGTVEIGVKRTSNSGAMFIYLGNAALCYDEITESGQVLKD